MSSGTSPPDSKVARQRSMCFFPFLNVFQILTRLLCALDWCFAVAILEVRRPLSKEHRHKIKSLGNSSSRVRTENILRQVTMKLTSCDLDPRQRAYREIS